MNKFLWVSKKCLLLYWNNMGWFWRLKIIILELNIKCMEKLWLSLK